MASGAWGRVVALMIRAALALLVLALPAVARAEAQPRKMALGFQIDLFPTVVSAIAGHAGYAPQLWVGIDRLRLRLVGAHLEPPDARAFAEAGFRRPTTTALAAIVDCTFGQHFDGPWVGAGFEQWLRTLEHDGVDGKARWTSAIFTVGGGYIYRVAGSHFYVDAWVALHATLNPESVMVGAHEYKPTPLTPSGSIKLGYFFDL